MSWNYRFMRRVYPIEDLVPNMEPDVVYELHEVYYDEDASREAGYEVIEGWTKNPVTIMADDMNGAVWIAQRIAEAAVKPALDYHKRPQEQVRLEWVA